MYQRLRQEMIVGGGESSGPADSSSKNTAAISGLVIVGLLVWLGFANPWTLLFVVGLLVSVFLHEVGHYATAKWTGMKVTQFFMGFGPRLWSRTRGEVEWGVRALPLGAFVRIVGMNALDEVEPGDEDRAYRNKTFPRQFLVITAGSLTHFLLALAIFTGVYSTAGRYTDTGRVTVAFEPAAGSPAESAGLVVDDVITSIGDTPVESRDELVAAITSLNPGDRVEVEWRRDGVSRRAEVELAANPSNPGVAFLGVATSSLDYVEQSAGASVTWAVRDSLSTIGNSMKGVVTALNPLNSIRALQSPDENLETRPTTVVGASQIGGQLGESEGLKGVLILLASVNVFVGVFNLFPLLPFDGGHAAIATYERLRSRGGKRYRADVNKMIPVTTVVLGLLGFLLFVGLYLDITNPL
ncbi:MAG: site-2 protease family protein [Ilumatobacteraceae bacterium]|nr:site-2 protease family protein [Ilumatobacteraceae bacterium]